MSVVERADAPVPERPAAIVVALVLGVAALAADPLIHAVYDTLDREPTALAWLRERADPEPASSAPLARSAVVVIVDGLRLDASEGMPSLAALRRAGTSATVQVGMPSLSMPFYHALFTGVPQEGSGVRKNTEGRRQRLDGLTDRVHAAGGRVEFYQEGVDWFSVMYGRDGDVVAGLGAPLDRAVAALATAPGLLVVHTTDVDHESHVGGVGGPAYDAAIAHADDVIARVARHAPRDAVLVVVADHGHIDVGGHGGDEPDVKLSPLVVRAPGVRVGERIERIVRHDELAPTIAALIGVPAPRSAVTAAADELAPPSYQPPRGVPDRARAVALATDVDAAARRRDRVWMIGLLVLVALGSLGAVKRAFGGFDRGSLVAPVAWVVACVAGHLVVLGRPLTISAIDEIGRHGPRLVTLGAGAALLAVVLAVLTGPRAVRFVVRLRRAAASIGWIALVLAAATVAWSAGGLGPWPLTPLEQYACIPAFACGAGACVVSTAVLLGSALARPATASSGAS